MEIRPVGNDSINKIVDNLYNKLPQNNSPSIFLPQENAETKIDDNLLFQLLYKQ